MLSWINRLTIEIFQVNILAKVNSIISFLAIYICSLFFLSICNMQCNAIKWINESSIYSYIFDAAWKNIWPLSKSNSINEFRLFPLFGQFNAFITRDRECKSRFNQFYSLLLLCKCLWAMPMRCEINPFIYSEMFFIVLAAMIAATMTLRIPGVAQSYRFHPNNWVI